MPRKITLKDVASEVGVHPATVSKALNNHPKIPESTRERIRQAAQRLGYTPDPLLSALSHYRRRSSTSSEKTHGLLAFVTSWPKEHNLTYQWGQRYLLPAVKKAAQQRGYRLDYINMATEGLSGERLSKLLYARGVTGVIVAESPTLKRLKGLNESQFCFVGIGGGIEAPNLHCVVTNPYGSMWTAIQTLKQRNFTRMGFLIQHWQDARTQYQWSAAYTTALRHHKLSELEAFYDESDSPAEIQAWVQRIQPDVILHYSDQRLNNMPPLPKTPSRGPVLINLNLPNQEKGAGIHQNLGQVGQTVVDILGAKIQHHKRGFEASRIKTVVDGTWCN